MADNNWRKERIRSYLLSYNELLRLLKKYPKSSPYKLTNDVSTQTSPHLCKETYNKLNTKMKDISLSTSPTEIVSPSPHTNHKGQHNPCKIKSKTTKTMHASAIKVSDSLINNLTNNNENNTPKNKINRKRSFEQLNDSFCPSLKKRKISPKDIRKNMLLKYYDMNNNNEQSNENDDCESIESFDQINSNNIFDLLPELNENDIKKCDELVNNSMICCDNFDEKQMGNEIIRFENNNSNKNHSSNWETFVIRTEKHKYTPLWKASAGRNLPKDEKYFDMNKLRVNNNKCPLDKYDYKYLNNDYVSPSTKMAQCKLTNNCKYEETINVSDSDIVEKYQKNVSCFGGNMNVLDSICSEDNSLFDNTNFSDEQMKVNSLLRD